MYTEGNSPEICAKSLRGETKVAIKLVPESRQKSPRWLEQWWCRKMKGTVGSTQCRTIKLLFMEGTGNTGSNGGAKGAWNHVECDTILDEFELYRGDRFFEQTTCTQSTLQHKVNVLGPSSRRRRRARSAVVLFEWLMVDTTNVCNVSPECPELSKKPQLRRSARQPNEDTWGPPRVPCPQRDQVELGNRLIGPEKANGSWLISAK